MSVLLLARARDVFEQSIVEQRGKNTRMNLRNIRSAKLVALTVVDEDGNRIFSG